MSYDGNQHGRGLQGLNRQISSWLPIALVALVVGWLLPNLESQRPPQENPHAALKRPSKHSGPLPKAEFAAISTETPAEQLGRRSRESRKRNSFPFVVDPGRLVDGQAENTVVLIEDIVYVANSDPSYPASLSSAVIVGTVLTAKGFVSDDRTYVYSDYQIRVDEVLKQDPNKKLVVGGQVLVSRTGAAVHFTSGHVTNYVVLERGMPQAGQQYLLFLWRPDLSVPTYELIYGATYKLSYGRAYPLDDDHYYREVADGDAPLLLAKVKKAIAALRK